jgi:hypothetical protein
VHGRKAAAIARLKPVQKGRWVKGSRGRHANQSEAAGPRSGDHAVGGEHWRHGTLIIPSAKAWDNCVYAKAVDSRAPNLC